jgi:hypothetical protein
MNAHRTRRVAPVVARATLLAASLWLLAGSASAQSRAGLVDPAPWQAILSTYATGDGGFRYAALRGSEADRARLEGYLEAVASARPERWPRDAQLAFYLNAYNALVVKAVLSHWPLESVRAVEGFFDGERHRVAGRSLTLNQLENDVIRSARFDEPRIHFAVSCASAGCPPLSRRAYTASNLEAQLARRSRAFVRRTTRVGSSGVRLSQIFEWFADDFGGERGVRAFVAARLDDAAAARVRDPSVPLRYTPYDWDLNDRR